LVERIQRRLKRLHWLFGVAAIASAIRQNE